VVSVVSRVCAGLADRHVQLVGVFVVFLGAVIGLIFGQSAEGVVLGVAVATFAVGVLAFAVQTRIARTTAADRYAELFARGRLPASVRDSLGGEGRYDAGVGHEVSDVLDELGDVGRHRGYLLRDVDDELRQWLSAEPAGGRCRAVVLDGPSKAGKSRTMLEAILICLSDAVLVRPASSTALEELAVRCPEQLAQERSIVIWLDDLENWLGAPKAPLELATLDALDSWSATVLLAGTLGGRGLAQLRDDQGDGPRVTQPIDDFKNGLRNTRAAESFVRTLHASPSAAELNSLIRVYGNQRAIDIQRAGGIGSYLIAGPKLLERLADADPVAAGVVGCAVAWRRLGLTRPIPRSMLEELHRYFVRPPHRPATDITPALEWATAPVYSSQILILSDAAPEAYSPADYIASRAPSAPGDVGFNKAVINTLAEPVELLQVGVTAYERSDLAGAEAAWRRGDERGDGTAAYNLGVLLFERRELDQAEAAWRRGDKHGNGDAAYNLGVLLAGRGELDQAEAAYRRGDKRGNRDAANNLGVLLAQRGELDQAEAAYRRGDERGGGGGASNLGALLFQRGELDQAEAAFNRGDERGDGTAAYNLGVLVAQRGELDQAEAAYRRGDERGNGDAANKLGVLLFDRRELELAEAAWHRGDERGNGDAADYLGLLLAQRGELDQAEAAWRRADKRGHGGAADNLGVLLRERGCLEEADACFARARARDIDV
jgi:tetratricopeptide (TPR) repeat protein